MSEASDLLAQGLKVFHGVGPSEFYPDNFQKEVITGLDIESPVGDTPMLYRIWDCLLYLSGGEGFGLPAWEAMCSALPVVYTNYSAHAEFVGRGKAGLAVGGILQPEAQNCIWRMVADIGQAVEAVRRLYFDRQLGKQLGENGREFAREFSISKQIEAWHRTFMQLREQEVRGFAGAR